MKTKKIIALFLAIVLIFGLVGCSGNTPGGRNEEARNEIPEASNDNHFVPEIDRPAGNLFSGESRFSQGSIFQRENHTDREESEEWAEPAEPQTAVDPNLLELTNVVELEGFAVSAGPWCQIGIDLTDEQKALFVPGCVIEISYSSEIPVWLVAVSYENPNPKGVWLRGINEDTFVTDGYVSTQNNVVQYTYEMLVPYFGDNFGQYLDTLQCESYENWEVYSVKVGTRRQ